ADDLGVRIEYDLRRGESLTLLRIPGTVPPVTLEVSRTDVRKVAVPHLIGAFGKRHAQRLAVRFRGVEETEIDLRRIFRAEREIDAARIPRGAERIRRSWPDTHRTSVSMGEIKTYNPKSQSHRCNCVLSPCLLSSCAQMLVADFDFDLPPELIAQEPRPRGESRLMVVRRDRTGWEESAIPHLPDFLATGDLLVLNDTRVFPARLLGRRDPSGGTVECLLLERTGDDIWDALVHPGQKLKPGARLVFDDPVRAP